MKDVSEWQIPKPPFYLVNAVLIAAGFYLIVRAPHPITLNDAWLPVVCLLAGAAASCLPFILEYRATKKLIEINALSAVAEQMQDLKKFSAQVATATDQWALVQEATKGNTDKTVATAKEIADRMAEEIREFNEFQQKLNDTEKGALRLEVEKLRRAEGEWLQVVARILDHIFSLHTAASRSGNPDLAEQINNFQNACRDAARRVGLAHVGAAEGDKFDAEKHRAHGVENPPAEAAVAETLVPGLTFQGRLLRPILVRLQTADAPAAGPVQPIPAEKPEPNEDGSFELEAK